MKLREPQMRFRDGEDSAMLLQVCLTCRHCADASLLFLSQQQSADDNVMQNSPPSVFLRRQQPLTVKVRSEERTQRLNVQVTFQRQPHLLISSLSPGGLAWGHRSLSRTPPEGSGRSHMPSNLPSLSSSPFSPILSLLYLMVFVTFRVHVKGLY